MNDLIIEIIQPDDWHIHLREGKVLNIVSKFSSRINNRCIVMPNLTNPITTSFLAEKYISEIKKTFTTKSFTPLIPCYLTDTLNLKDFEQGLDKKTFIGKRDQAILEVLYGTGVASGWRRWRRNRGTRGWRQCSF